MIPCGSREGAEEHCLSAHGVGVTPAAIEVCDSPEPVWPGPGFSLNLVAAGLSAWDGGLPNVSPERVDEESNEVLVIGNV